MKELLLSYLYCIKSCIYMYEYAFFLSFHMWKKKNILVNYIYNRAKKQQQPYDFYLRLIVSKLRSLKQIETCNRPKHTGRSSFAYVTIDI